MLSSVRVGAFVVLWSLLHTIAPTLLRSCFRQQIRARIDDLRGERLTVLRRLARAQIYYMLAGPLGAWLLYSAGWDLRRLLGRYTALHDLGFSLALSLATAR